MTRTLTADDVADRVAELLPALDRESETFRDACEGFAASLNYDDHAASYDETTRAHDAGLITLRMPDPVKFYGRRGGGVEAADIMSEDRPDAVGKHVVKRGRSKRGATALVLRRGVAPVIGRTDVDVNGTPIMATPAEGLADVANPAWTMAQMLTRHVRRVPGGMSSADVLRVTNLGAALDELPMLGTDALAWCEVVPGDRSSRCSTAVHTSDLSGQGGHATLGRFVAQTDAYAAHTDRQRWATRLLLTYRARKSDPATVTTPCGRHAVTFRVRVAPWWSTVRPDTITPRYLTVTMSVPMVSRTELVSASADAERIHVGCRTTARAARTDRDRTGKAVKRGAVRARTVADVPTEHAPTTATGWAELAAMLNRGERLTCGAVTITRSAKSGKYAATDKRSDVVRWETRTADALGMRLATT